jgi:methyl-accepting chemotaxis protein
MDVDTSQSTTRTQRKVVLVKRTLQLKYIALIFASVTMAIIILGTDFYYTMYRLILLDNPSLVPLLHHAHSIFLVRALIYLTLIFAIAMFVSHRFAGPIYRFEQSAQAVGSGDLTHRVSLRTGDELLELQEEFNGMVSNLQSLVQKDRNLIHRLSSRLDAIQKQLPDSANGVREELRSLRAELQHITASFKA